MDALKAAGLCALLAASPQTQSCGPVVQISSPAIERWQSQIAAASLRLGLPATWIRAVMARESAGFSTFDGRPLVSRAGAMGLMQVMPGTWSDMRVRYRLGNDPFDPHDNIIAGAAYLREMFDRYGYPNLFAAYHAGPGRLHAVLAGHKSLPDATETYLESIVPGAETGAVLDQNRMSNPSKPSPNSLFFMRTDDEKSPGAPVNSHNDDANSAQHPQGLFVPLASQRPSPAH